MFCDVSISPHVADSLFPVSPEALAELILPPENDDTPAPDAIAYDEKPRTDAL
ncbi:MAG: hypothetical protein FD153_1456 [Rhodospirillaceae bacterium]|nr:MAG: hypothetical protein FD153_1456 [Rhodospirillaceae bacterium]